MEFLVCSQPTMSQFETKGFRDIVSQFLDDFSLHSLIGDMTSTLAYSSGTLKEDENKSKMLLQHFLHPFESSISLDLAAMVLPHVPHLFLFVARRRRTDP